MDISNSTTIFYNPDGIASNKWTIGYQPGPQKLEASININGLPAVTPVEFTATSSGSPLQGTTIAAGNGKGDAANQLSNPRGIFVDNAGAVYIADNGNNRVQKWLPGATSGITVAGGNGKGAASNQLDYPTGIFVDANHTIYIADNFNHRVQKWAPGASSGITVAAGGNSSATYYPYAVWIDGAGVLYVSNISFVYKWLPGESTGIKIAGNSKYNPANSADDLWFATSISVDAADNLFIADSHNNRVQKWAPGATSGITVAGGYGPPFFGNSLSHAHYGTNQRSTYGPNPGWNSNQLYFPAGMCLDKNGAIYIADSSNGRIQKWIQGASSGNTVAGGNGSGNGANQLAGPASVFVTSNGTIYVADAGNNRVQKFVP